MMITMAVESNGNQLTPTATLIPQIEIPQTFPEKSKHSIQFQAYLKNLPQNRSSLVTIPVTIFEICKFDFHYSVE